MSVSMDHRQCQLPRTLLASKTRLGDGSTGILLHWAAGLLLVLCSTSANAGPSGGNIVGGSGTIQQSNLTTNIHQNTQSMVINWDSYNAGNLRVKEI